MLPVRRSARSSGARFGADPRREEEEEEEAEEGAEEDEEGGDLDTVFLPKRRARKA